MFTNRVNLLDGLRLIQIEPHQVTGITVYEKSIEVITDLGSKTLPLIQSGVTNPFANNDLTPYTTLRQVKFVFPNANFTLEQWRQFMQDTYKNLPTNITFSLVTDKETFSDLSDDINKRNQSPSIPQPTVSLSKPTDVSVGMESEPYDEDDTYDDEYEDDEYEDDDYEEDYEEDYEDDYDDDVDEEYTDEDNEYSESPQSTATQQQSSESASLNPPMTSSERDEEISEFAEELTSTIIETYNKIYPSCYIQRPYGILTTIGILTFNAESKTIGIRKGGLNSFIINAFAKYTKADGTIKQLNNMNLSQAINGSGLLYNYMPLLQAEIAYGIKYAEDGKVEVVSKWGDYADYLHNRIKNVVFNLLKTRRDTFDINFQNQIVSMFTNTILLLEYDKSKAMHLVYKLTSAKVDLARYLIDNAQNLFAKVGEVISNPKPNDEFNRLLYAFNPENYHREILFAYKMYQQIIDSGSIPSAKELIIGRTLDGNDMKLDLENRQGIIGAIMAGPRSGKGVLTLSVLAGLMAHEKDNKTIPFIYCDGKPEMSATLWEIERKLQAQGIDARILAIEGNNPCTDDGVGPNRGNRIVNGRSVWDFGRNLPEGVELKGLSIIPYLKMMQLFSAMAQASLPNIPSYTGRYARVMMILDETIAIKGVYNDFCSSLYSFLKTNKPRGKAEPSDEYLYVHKLATVLTHIEDDTLLLTGQMTSKFVGTLVSEGPRKGFGVIQIGQYTTPGQWESSIKPKTWEKNPFGFLMKNATWRILGKNSGQSSAYGLSELKAEGMSLVGKLENGESPDVEKGQLGYFVYTNGATKEANVQKVFKSYLALNENDYNVEDSTQNGIFTTQLLSNAGDEMTRKSIIKNDLLRPDGSVRTEVGFLGLAQMLMSDPNKLVERLTSGYNLVWEFMVANGLAERYSCVEDYLVDCSPNSIFSIEELSSGVSFTGESASGSIDYDSEVLDSSFSSPVPNATPTSTNSLEDIPQVKSTSQAVAEQPNRSIENHFNPTLINTPNYSSTTVETKELPNKQLTVRQLMGDKLFNMNKTYLDNIKSSIVYQDSVRSKETICHKPFKTIDVQRIEPLSEILVPPFLNIEWLTNKMCQSKRFSGLGRKLKQQGFYRKHINRKETRTMLLSIGEALGGLDTVTHLDIVNRQLMFNNMNFNFCGEINIDNFDVFQLTKLVKLQILGTDVPLSLTRILSGLKCESIDDMWKLFDELDEVQCMGQTFKRNGEIADQTSLFQTEEEEKAIEEESLAKYEELTQEPTKESNVKELSQDLEDVLSDLPPLDMPDDIKRGILMDMINALCTRKYSRVFPIELETLPDIDYFNEKEVSQYAVKCIIDYFNSLKGEDKDA